MEETLQHHQTTRCFGLPPASPENHRPDGPKAGHALTFKLDQLTGAGHYGNPNIFFQDMTNQSSNCPLCGSIQNSCKTAIAYPGSFLSCAEIVECHNCNLFYAAPMPTEDNLENYYETGMFWHGVADPFQQNIIDFSLRAARSRLSLLANQIDLTEVSRIIDIGSGNGQFGYAFQEFSSTFIYDIVEPDQKVASQIGKIVVNCFSHIDQADQGSYDLAVMNHVLEHVSDPIRFLRHISNLLKPNGTIFIEVPFLDFHYKENVEPHLLFWTPESLNFLLSECNFQLLFCSTVGMPYSVAQRFFKRMPLVEKLTDHWCYKGKINDWASKIGVAQPFDILRRFQFDSYGGSRQWLRCVTQKIP